MLTTVVIQDERIIIYHTDGTSSSYMGIKATEKDALKAIKEIILKTNNMKAIGDAMVKAEAAKGINKLKASLKTKTLKRP